MDCFHLDKALRVFYIVALITTCFTANASDTELSNTDGAAFHSNSGFTEISRVICYIKDLF